MNIIEYLYIVNLSMLFIHEMDAAYQKEWELFRLPGGINLFLAIHIPLYILAFYGLSVMLKQPHLAYIPTIISAAVGFIAFSLHYYFRKKGNPGFDTPMSKGILTAVLIISFLQFLALIF